MKPILQNVALLTDLYQLTMIQSYIEDGRENEPATFDYFFRKIPFNGGYVVFAGLNELLEILGELQFTDSDIDYLQRLNFKEKFINYIDNFSFKCDVYSVDEGSIVFANEPLLSVRGTLPQCQLVETVLLNTLNYNSLIATKASRMRLAAGEKILGDFGLRRSHGIGGYQASKAAIIGGFNSTSNVLSAKDFDLKPVGTMAHSFIQSYDDELTAFHKYAEVYPNDTILLVDTYDTLESGVPNAIKTAKELEEKGSKLKAIRLDSGDLIQLAKESRKMLDDAGLDYVKIVASNELDEYMIQKISDKNAPIDIFGVGTRLITGQPDAALDGVYKLSMINNKPTLKLSETKEKITLPGEKQITRYSDNAGKYVCDAITLNEENPTDDIYNRNDENVKFNLHNLRSEKLLQKVMGEGEVKIEMKSVEKLREDTLGSLKKLPDGIKKLENPETYPVGLSKKLIDTRNVLTDKYE